MSVPYTPPLKPPSGERVVSVEETLELIYPRFLRNVARIAKTDLLRPFYKQQLISEKAYLTFSAFEDSLTHPERIPMALMTIHRKLEINKRPRIKLRRDWINRAKRLINLGFRESYLPAFMLYFLAGKENLFFKQYRRELEKLNISSEEILKVRLIPAVKEWFIQFAEFLFIETEEMSYIPLSQLEKGFKQRLISLGKELIPIPKDVLEEKLVIDTGRLSSILRKEIDFSPEPPNIFLSYLKGLEKEYSEIRHLVGLISPFLNTSPLYLFNLV